jgi:hypothetical protein
MTRSRAHWRTGSRWGNPPPQPQPGSLPPTYHFVIRIIVVLFCSFYQAASFVPKF